MTRPLIIAHRGASAYLPENTLEAFNLAFTQGADAIETDLVPTVDGTLILRHENNLTDTTNIADHPELAHLHQESTAYNGAPLHGWFTETLTVDQIRTLTAREHLPHLRPGSATHNDRYQIPTLDDLLTLPSIADKALILELKHEPMFRARGIHMIPMLTAALKQTPLPARTRIMIQTFTLDTALRVKEALPHIPALFIIPATPTYPVTPAEIRHLATLIDGVSIDTTHLNAPGLAETLAETGLLTYTWTSQLETPENISDPDWYTDRIAQRPHGMFTDHPDRLHAALHR